MQYDPDLVTQGLQVSHKRLLRICVKGALYAIICISVNRKGCAAELTGFTEN